MGTTTACTVGIDNHPTLISMAYRFFAITEGMRIPLRIEAICGSDAEASLVAISRSTRLIGIEVWHGGALVYRAPRRQTCRATTLTTGSFVDGTA